MLVSSLRVSSDTDRQTTCNTLRSSTPAWSAPLGSHAPRCMLRSHVALQRMPYGRIGRASGRYPALSITPYQGLHAVWL
jgi:hypothetical protein